MFKWFLKNKKLNSKIKLSNNSYFVVLIFAIFSFQILTPTQFYHAAWYFLRAKKKYPNKKKYRKVLDKWVKFIRIFFPRSPFRCFHLLTFCYCTFFFFFPLEFFFPRVPSTLCRFTLFWFLFDYVRHCIALAVLCTCIPIGRTLKRRDVQTHPHTYTETPSLGL